MKIVTLCGCGLGTCYILKFTVETAIQELNLIASVTPSDIGSIGLEKADLYLAPYGLNSPPDLQKSTNLIAIKNVLSVSEVKQAIQESLSSKK